MAAGDGCASCRFECKADMDCDDGNPCNGAETCDKSMAGKQLCKAGTAPPTAPPAPSRARRRLHGRQLREGGLRQRHGRGGRAMRRHERRRRRRLHPACKFTCNANADCSDGNMCTGVESCNTTTHRCEPGTAVTCTATGSCQAAGTCTPATGVCIYPDADRDGKVCNTDCNDADPAVFPGGFECKDGKDNDCNPATLDATAPGCECYVDTDATATRSTSPGPSPRPAPARPATPGGARRRRPTSTAPRG